MHTPESYYFGALKRALEGDLEGAFSLQERAEEAREAFGYSFSEAVSDEFPFVEEAVTTLLSSYDFTRCVRPDGSSYGTGGKCRKGTESAKSAEPKMGYAGGNREPKMGYAGGNRKDTGITLKKASSPPTFSKEDASKVVKEIREKTGDHNFVVEPVGKEGKHRITHAYYGQREVNKTVKDHVGSGKPASKAKVPSNHVSDLKELDKLHKTQTGYTTPGTHREKVREQEKKVLDNEASLMRKNPEAAGAILSHATRMAEVRRKQAEAAHQKLIRLTQDTGAGYIRPGGRRDQEGEARTTWNERDNQADFHDTRAEQARKAMG